MRVVRPTLLTTVVALVLACCTSAALANTAAVPRATLRVGFVPYRLGSSTTVEFAFKLAGANGAMPSPVTGVSLRLPAQIAYETSALGVASCDLRTLLTLGASGCPVNSRIGFGSAVVSLPLGSAPLQEKIQVTPFVSSAAHGRLDVLYYASGDSPVIARLVFPGELLPGSFGASSIDTSIPSIATLPEAPDASLIAFDSTIGPKGLYYQASAHGRTVRYRPRGIVLPVRCPRGGFRFSARFDFEDGATQVANSTLPCPRGGR